MIHLSRAGYLSLLQTPGLVVVVPSPVVEEIRAKGPDDVTARAIEQAPWLRVVAPLTVPEEIAAWDLGPGESSVLAWARQNPGSVALLDDLQGRRCALAPGITVLGTLGVILDRFGGRETTVGEVEGFVLAETAFRETHY